MTPEQTITLRASCFADPVAAAFFPLRDNVGLCAYLNQNSAFIVWRTLVTQDEITLNGFDWARVDNLSVGKARIWQWMFDNNQKAINPSKPNVRAGIDQTWAGTAADLAVRAAVYVHCKRPARVYEKMLASGGGTDANPGLLKEENKVVVEGELFQHEADTLMFKPDGSTWTAGG